MWLLFLVKRMLISTQYYYSNYWKLAIPHNCLSTKYRYTHNGSLLGHQDWSACGCSDNWLSYGVSHMAIILVSPVDAPHLVDKPHSICPQTLAQTYLSALTALSIRPSVIVHLQVCLACWTFMLLKLGSNSIKIGDYLEATGITTRTLEFCQCIYCCL